MRKIALAALFTAFSLHAQTTSNDTQILSFKGGESTQQMNEIATCVRTIADIRQAAVNPSQKTFAIQGTSAQLALAGWMFVQLDAKTANPPAEFKMEGYDDNIVHIYYLPNTPTVQDFQEVATLVRTIGDIRRVFTYNAARALTVRGSQEQIALTDWIIANLNQKIPGEYKMASGDDNIVRIYYLPNTLTIPDFQNAAVLVRHIAETRRIFTYNSPRAFALRGTADQAALADWLVANLIQKPGAIAQSADYRLPAGDPDGEDQVRLFYVSSANSARELQELANQIRATTLVRRMTIFPPPRVIAIRGTATQIATAQQIVSANKPQP
jgi:hypothetical protein